MILCLETSSRNCSVGLLYEDGRLAVREERSERYIHAEKLHPFIDELLREQGVQAEHLKAVAVGQGPGSFTGLRIGIAAAKGMCYALEIPMIALNSLEVLARSLDVLAGELLIPVMDARRMEVYSQVFTHDYLELREIRAEIITDASFLDYREAHAVHLIGDGAGKCSGLLANPPFVVHSEALPSVSCMGELVRDKWISEQFVDPAYFEPFYLKEFQTTAPRKPKG